MGSICQWDTSLPLKPKTIQQNVPRTLWAKAPPTTAPPSLQGICENSTPTPHIHGPFSIVWNSCAFPLHLSPFLSAPGGSNAPPLHRRPPPQSCHLVNDAEHIRAASLRWRPSHRICYNIDDGRCTRSATPSTKPVAPDLLQHRRWVVHRMCYPFNEAYRTRSATMSTTSGSSDLLPLRRSLLHRICYNVDDGWRSRSASPSVTTSSPVL